MVKMNIPPSVDEKKVHPIDRVNIFSRIFFSWVGQVIKTSKVQKWEQKFHYELPYKDNIRTNEEKFCANFEQTKGLFSTIVKTFKADLLIGILWATLFVAADYSVTMVLFRIMSFLQRTQMKQKNLMPGEDNAAMAKGEMGEFVAFLALNLVLQFFSALFQNWNQMHFSRLSIRIRSCIIQLVLKKAFKFSVLNPSGHTEGKIINFIQVDTQKFETSVFFLVNFLVAILQIIIGLMLIAYVAGETVWMVIICLVFANMINVCINWKYFTLQTKIMTAKDNRVNTLKNMINNYKFVKLKALENFFSLKIYLKRLREVNLLKGIAWTFSTLIFMNWVNPSLFYLASLLWIIFFETGMTVADTSAFIKLLDQMGGGLRNLPYCIQFFSDLAVSVKRINCFLLAQEIDDDYIKRIKDWKEIDDKDFISNLKKDSEADEKVPLEKKDNEKKTKMDLILNKLANTKTKDTYKGTTTGQTTEGYVQSVNELANLTVNRKESEQYYSAEQEKKYHNTKYKKPAVVLVNGNFFWRKNDERREEEKQKVTNEKQKAQLDKIDKLKQKGMHIIDEEQELVSKGDGKSVSKRKQSLEKGNIVDKDRLVRKFSISAKNLDTKPENTPQENNAIKETKKNNPMNQLKFGQGKKTRENSFAEDFKPETPRNLVRSTTSQQLDDINKNLGDDLLEVAGKRLTASGKKKVKFDVNTSKSKTAPLKNLSGLREALLDYESDEESVEAKGFQLQNMHFKINDGALVFIIGKVGSGKSSLLYSFLGEMSQTLAAEDRPNKTSKFNESVSHMSLPQTAFYRPDTVSYLSQRPLLFSKSIKDNIVLDLEFEKDRFDQAIHDAGMDDDLKMMDNGMDKNIGENGSALSGGQRVRLALARCIYRKSELYLFDDPLSALDYKVGDFIMRNTIKKKLVGTTRIIVTHAIHYACHADRVIIMEEGDIVADGTYEKVKKSPAYKRLVKEDIDIDEDDKPPVVDSNINNTLQPEEKMVSRKGSLILVKKASAHLTEAEQLAMIKRESTVFSDVTSIKEVDDLLEADEKAMLEANMAENMFGEETTQSGRIGWVTIKSVMDKLGGVYMFIIIYLLFQGFQVMNVYVNGYIIGWSKNFNSPDTWSNFKFLCLFLTARCFLSFFLQIFCMLLGARVSRLMHARMVYHIIHAKITSFLERVPSGRIINRFTSCIDMLDLNTMPRITLICVTFSSQMLDFCMIVTGTTYYAIIMIFVFILSALYMQNIYIRAKSEIVRLLNTTRSPIAHLTTEIMRGLPEIRAMKLANFIHEEMRCLVNENLKNSLLTFGLNGWFQLRVAFLNLAVIQLPAFIYQAINVITGVDTTQVAMMLIYATMISNDAIKTLQMVSDLETILISVEFCVDFEKIEPESKYTKFQAEEEKMVDLPQKFDQNCSKMVPNVDQGYKIIKAGKVQFKKVSARYPSKVACVISNLNFTVLPGQKIGVVGRTGAGKTSLLKLFWRGLDTCAGQIQIDDKDITECDLKVLRSEMDVISQETALFAGTLRENLDPSSDADLNKDAHLRKILDQLEYPWENPENPSLDEFIDADGSNKSIGVRQILCFARILVNPRKLVILDEATANVDMTTEGTVKQLLKEGFPNSTMFIIAHRLESVKHCDKIIVLSNGKIAEQGTHDHLISLKDGIYSGLWNKMIANQDEA